MYAIIRAGGKQYRVKAGDTVRVEKLEKNLGETFDMSEVLMVGGDKNFVGAPLVKNAKVTVVVTRQAKASKIIVFKKKRRQGYRKMQGHRQWFTELFVQSITTPEGQTFNTENKPLIIDPAKIQARKEAAAEKQKETKTAKSSKVEAAPKKLGAGGSDKPKQKLAKKASAKKVAKKPAAKSGTKTAGKKAAKKK
jgi:large subunit ribosomal protein L21